MPGSNSIGSLYIDVAARTAQLQTDVQSIKGIVGKLQQDVAGIGTTAQQAGTGFDKLGGTVQKAGVGARLQFMAFREAIRLVTQEVTSVIQNIQNIEGVPQSTIDSVNNLKYSFSETKKTLDQWTASGIGFLNDVGEDIGNFVGKMLYGQAAVDAAIKHAKEASDKLANKDYNDRVAGLNLQLAHGSMSRGQLADALRGEQIDLFAQANGTAGTEKDRQDAMIKGLQDEIQSTQILRDLRTKSSDDYIALLDAANKAQGKELSTQQQIEEVTRQLAAENDHLLRLKAGPQTGATMEQEDAIEKRMKGQVEHLGDLLVKLKEPMNELRDTFAHDMEGVADEIAAAFNGASISGKKILIQLTQDIEATFLKIAAFNPLLNAIFGPTTGWKTLPALFSIGSGAASGGAGSFTGAGGDVGSSTMGYAAGGPYNPNAPFLVGENGPEIVDPNSRSVIPASATSRMLSSRTSGGGDTYVIDARGADEVRIAALERRLVAMNASVERRAVTAVASVKNRGGAAAKALA